MTKNQFEKIVNEIGNFHLLKQSSVEYESVNYGMVKQNSEHKLVVMASTNENNISAFQGKMLQVGGGQAIIAPLTAENAFAVRTQLPWLQSQCL